MRTFVRKIQNASDTPFDNTSNDFDAIETQSAVEEIDFRQETLEPTGFKNTRYDSIATFNETTRLFSISPLSVEYEYFIRGHRFVKTGTDSITVPNISGLWFIFYVGTSLTTTQTPWSFTDEVAFVKVIYWNADFGIATLINEERHGLVTDWASHRYNHYTIGMTRQKDKIKPYNFILRGDGTLDAHATIAYTNLGLVFDEDLDFLPVNSATPTNAYEQKIDPILWSPVLYRSGPNGYWTKLTATQFPLAWVAGQRIRYNQWTGSTWQLTQADEGYFVCMWVALTADERHPFITFLDDAQHLTIVEAAAQEWADFIGNALPVPEILSLQKFIYKTSSLYTNQPKAVLFAVLDVNDVTVDNDRYTVEMGVGGNAGVGKYMDRSTGESSLDNPFTFPEASFIRYVTIQGQRGTTFTAVIGLYNVLNLTTPVITFTVTNLSYAKFSTSQYFESDVQVAYKIISGNINKPLITTWVQTQLG